MPSQVFALKPSQTIVSARHTSPVVVLVPVVVVVEPIDVVGGSAVVVMAVVSLVSSVVGSSVVGPELVGPEPVGPTPVTSMLVDGSLDAEPDDVVVCVVAVYVALSTCDVV